MIVDSLRGMGGTGLGIVKTNYEVETFRRALPGADFINSDVGGLSLRDIDIARIAVGHNRAATIGSIKDKNCHPFHYGDKREIMLVHNGTLHSYHSLSPAGFNHEVDSAHAAAALATSENVGVTLKKFRGPFVFVWWDGKDKTFNIARNEFRDIWYVQSKDNTIYFGSEYKMVDWLLDRVGVELEDNVKYSTLGDHQWFSWGIEDGKISQKFKLTDIKPEFPIPGIFNGSRRTHDRVPDKSESKMATNLTKLGLREDELIYIRSRRFETYAQSNQGVNNKERIIGKIVGESVGTNDVLEVWIHSISEARYEFLKETFPNLIPVRVKGAYAPWKNADEFVISCEIKAKDLFKFGKKGGDTGKLKLSAKVKEILKKEKEEEHEDVDGGDFEEDFVSGPNGIYITTKSWRELVKSGCAMCTEIPSEDDHAKVAWLNDATPVAFLCPKCGDDAETREAANLPAKIEEKPTEVTKQ